MRIMSIDAETNGLWGNPFAIAGILYDEQGKEIDKIVFRMPSDLVDNEWVKDNVLPTLEDLKVTHNNYESMLKDFSKWYMSNKENTNVLYHMGHVVEAYLFREMHRLGFIGDFDAPYVPIEVSEHLKNANESADSVDSYKEKYNLKVADYGSTHNPLYDCEVAFKVYNHIIKNK